MSNNNLTKRALSALDRGKELVSNRVEPKHDERGAALTGREANVAEVLAYLSAEDQEFVKAQGWDRPGKCAYLESYVTAKIEAGEVEV